MTADLSRIWALSFAAVGLSAASAYLFVHLAPGLGLIDHPGGRKAHDVPVPLVGGLSIFTAVLLTAALTGYSTVATILLFALAIIIALGMWDDARDIRPLVKFGIQILACAVMIWGAGVELRSVGDLVGLRPIGLSILAVPLTIFAVIGVVNAVNMVDGLDGLGGSLAFVAFAWYAAVAASSGLQAQFNTAVIFTGAIAGFLAFNLRFPWQRQARIFLGDAGSLMLGFALAWFAIDLTQGPGRTFPPIAALWVLLLPLADCVSLIVRRLRRGRSPFVADRHHLHHYLLARGFSPEQSVLLLVLVSTIFGAVGYFGWRFQVPQPYLFWSFFFGFFAYHFWIHHAWKRIETVPESALPDLQEEKKVYPA